MAKATAPLKNSSTKSAAGTVEFLTSLSWKSSVPRKLREAAAEGDVRRFVKRFLKGRRPRSGRSAGAAAFGALWSVTRSQAQLGNEGKLPAAGLIEAARHFAGRPAGTRGRGEKGTRKPRDKGTRSQLSVVRSQESGSGWHCQLSSDNCQLTTPLELLIVGDLLLDAGDELPAETWLDLFQLMAVSAAESDWCPESIVRDGPPRACDLLVAEWEWKCSLLLQDVEDCSHVPEASAAELGRALFEGTDTDGTPTAEVIPDLPQWLAPLVRASAWSRRFDTPLWEEETAERFRGLVGFAVSLLRSDGSLAGCDGPPEIVLPLLSAAVRLASWSSRSRVGGLLGDIDRLLGRSKRVSPSRRMQQRTTAQQKSTVRTPARQSDWAELALLRTDWTADADLLLLTHEGRLPMVHLAALGMPLLDGEWGLELLVDGREVPLDGEWSCSCWFSDDDVDFAELGLSPAPGVQIDRQVLLSRTDGFAIFADCISAGEGCDIEYSARLPAAESVRIKPERATRECRLKRGGMRARAFPLFLPDDRVHSSPGELTRSLAQPHRMGTAHHCQRPDASVGDAPPTAQPSRSQAELGNEGRLGNEGGLRLSRSAPGGLYAPLVIDWHPDRRRTYAEWRSLTVSEEGRRLGCSEAGGYRLRIGEHHLLLYRAVRKATVHRAVLGLHTRHETVVGLFDEDGEIEPLLLVE